jgi:hypothetical protein
VDQRSFEEILIHKADISVVTFLEPHISFLHLDLLAIVPSSYSAESNPLRDTLLFKLSVVAICEISEKKSVLVKGWRVPSEEF